MCALWLNRDVLLTQQDLFEDFIRSRFVGMKILIYKTIPYKFYRNAVAFRLRCVSNCVAIQLSEPNYRNIAQKIYFKKRSFYSPTKQLWELSSKHFISTWIDAARSKHKLIYKVSSASLGAFVTIRGPVVIIELFKITRDRIVETQ